MRIVWGMPSIQLSLGIRGGLVPGPPGISKPMAVICLSADPLASEMSVLILFLLNSYLL